MSTAELGHACCQGTGNCGSFQDCQRIPVIGRFADLIRRCDKLGIKGDEIARLAHLDPTAVARLRNATTESPVSLSRLWEAEQRLKTALLPSLLDRISYVIGDREGKLQEAAVDSISFLEDCAIRAVTEAERTEASGAIFWNVLLALVGGSASARRELPLSLEGTYVQLGDPRIGVSVIQIDPPPTDATLDELIAHQQVVVHETRDVHRREQSRLRSLVARKEKTAPSASGGKPKNRLS